ncbi:MAG: hypothetical protein ACREB3_16375, partial [Burkholderiales bacterium]
MAARGAEILRRSCMHLVSTPTAFVVLAATVLALAESPSASDSIDVVELTIQSAQEGLRTERYTARQLAEASLARIATYNPGYNAIITPNPGALREADEIDRRRASGELLGP